LSGVEAISTHAPLWLLNWAFNPGKADEFLFGQGYLSCLYRVHAIFILLDYLNYD